MNRLRSSSEKPRNASCSIAANSSLILCAVCNAGTIRYNALRGKLDGVSNTVLSSALKELERDGLIERQEYLEVPVRVEYRPTERCRTLLPILEALSDWAEQDMK